MEAKMRMKFYGVRGSIPTPGKETEQYGGNTTCIEVTSSHGDEYIFDAGTGARRLGNDLMQRMQGRVNASVFLTHKHWDHIQGFPFFTPAYVPGCKIDIYGSDAIRETFAGQQDRERGYFPVGLEQMAATMRFMPFNDGDVFQNGVNIRSLRHEAHPQGMLSYKIQENGKTVVITGDYESDEAENDKKMIEWARNADILVMDGQYTNDEYAKKKGWGHSSIERACKLAKAAGVKRLYITHHEPMHDDETLKQLEASAQRYMEDTLGERMIPVFFAKEGKEIEVW